MKLMARGRWTGLRWPPQKNVWTPIGWKDHLFRFQVVYNSHLICSLK